MALVIKSMKKFIRNLQHHACIFSSFQEVDNFRVVLRKYYSFFLLITHEINTKELHALQCVWWWAVHAWRERGWELVTNSIVLFLLFHFAFVFHNDCNKLTNCFCSSNALVRYNWQANLYSCSVYNDMQVFV